MKAHAKLAIILAVAVPLSACGSPNRHEIGGTFIGGVAGATVGSLFGHGAGRVVSTFFGAAVGAYLGNHIGRTLDRIDQSYAMRNADYTMSTLPPGEPSNWNNPKTGNSGEIRATSRVYTGSNGLRCRRFREVISLRGGRREVIEGERCQKPDGTWIYVE